MSKEKLNGLVARLITILLITALFLPLFSPQKSQAAFRGSSSSSSQTIAPIFSPPEPFQVSDLMPRNSSLNLSVLDLTSNISNLFSASRLPEGFEMAKTPTFADKISSFFAPLFFASSSLAANAALLPPSGTTSFDFDGDDKADVARWQSSSGEWKIRNSLNGQTSTYLLGSNGQTIAPANYDGDGKTDAAVFSASTGTWTIRRSSDSTTQTITGFGQAGDKPVSGDYDGDGTADVAVYRNGTWLVKQSSDGNIVSTNFGSAGDLPVAGNYDGDLRMDYAVFRPSDGTWYVLRSSAGFVAFPWGISSDVPVPADYDGDNKTDFAVYRSTTGTWYAYKSSTGDGSYLAQNWGNYGDQPVPADYDGDNKADFAVWRPTTGVWFSIKSSDVSFDYKTLGVTGDTPVPSAYLKQTGAQVSPYDLAKARLSPKNAPGGTNFYSRNFGWSSALVGLSGRAGLDAGFGISYNSLVWTKQGNTIVFDADNDNVSSGFRFGFSTIEPSYYDSQTGRFAYLMVSPSGTRTEFRQIGASSYYETTDSSYAQLYVKGADSPNAPVEDLEMTVTGTDGTKMSYLWIAGAFRCNQIKDSNGNFITVNHDEYGLLRTVTDTLGRILTVNYDNELYPTTVTQTWKTNNGAGSNVTHVWATFNYTTVTVNTNFSGLTVVGPPNGSVLKVLQKITRPNGSYTTFDYNSYGQVRQINNYAADSHKLNHLSVNLPPDASQAQIDCPRFTETKSYAENFNGGAEVTVNNLITENQPYNVPGASGSATLIEISMPNHPNGAVSKTYVGSSGWRESLPIVTEDWAGGTRQRWTWTNWTQDDENLPYINNPRTTESKVGDAANTKRTTVEYYPISQGSPVALYGLVKEVKVYDANQTTVLKRTATEYNLSQIYLDKRIIGLPAKSELYDENGYLTAKVTYNYDEENFAQEPEQNISPTNHDTTNFGTSYITGRGNLTSTIRWDVNFPDNLSQAAASKVRYDVAGSPVARIDPLNRKVKVNYTDSFNDNQTRNSFAYPTKLTDPAGNFSEVKYRYDTGANVWAKSPAPVGNTNGKETTRVFDSLGRLEKETILNTGAYTRYEYPQNQIQSKVFTTIVDTNNNGADTADEVLAETWTDGAGKVRQSRAELPNSTGGYSGTLVEYDILGRVKRSTPPTEINSAWQPTGDDYRLDGQGNVTFLWTSQEYDWKGRITRQLNADGTDKIFSYQGCGCAGGQVTTTRGENIIETDWQGNPTATLGRRTQKIYADIQGRTYKTEVMNWDGVTPYTTTIHTFNGRDQIAQTRQTDNTTGDYRDITMTYDGHGRMKTRRYPIEDADKNTSWNYNADDSIWNVTDPRGVITSFAYNSRGLLETISYDPPIGSGIPDTPNVTFAYDNLGNRTSMQDGTGTTAYAYNQLSQMASETKTFNGISNSFAINYEYDLSGSLKSIGDPQDATRKIVYNFDKIGRTVGADESVSGALTQKVFGVKYRAWGAIKESQANVIFPGPANYLTSVKYKYDSRLQTSEYETSDSQGNFDGMKFQHYADGKLKYVLEKSVVPEYEGRRWLDRSYKYDHVGRLMQGFSGKDANNLPGVVDGPYRQNLSYNAFSETTQITGKQWTAPIPNFAAYFQNGRNTNAGTIYDAAGNIVQERIQTSPTILTRTITYDAAGRQVTSFDPALHSWESSVTITDGYDGNGWRMKHERVGNLAENTILIRSTVLGGEAVGTLNLNTQQKTFTVAVNGAQLIYDSVLGSSYKWTSPENLRAYSGATQTVELDPCGADAGMDDPTTTGGGGGTYPNYSDATNYARCTWEGSMIPCGMKEGIEDTEARVWEAVNKNREARSGGDTAHESQHNTHAARATRLTQKPNNAPDRGGLILSSSVPSDDGEEEDDGSTDEMPDIGTAGEVTISGDFWNNPVDASQTKNGDVIQFPVNLRERLVNRAGAKTPCGIAIQRLIDKVAENTNRKKKKNTDIGSLYDKVKNKIKPDNSLSPFEGRTGDDDYYVGGSKIRIGPATTNLFKENPFFKTTEKVYEAYVSAIIHELVHNSAKNGVYDDPEVLEAARDILKADGLKAPELTNNSAEASRRINSFYIGPNCPNPVKE